MILNNRLIGRSATLHPKSGDVEVDVGCIFRKLILFDTFILSSIRLKEIPEIVRRIGYESTLQLLNSKAFRIYCDIQTVGQTGQLTVLESREKKGALPKGSYCFQSITIPDRRAYISECFRESIGPISISKKEKKKLKYAILNALETPPEGIGKATIDQLKTDFCLGNPTMAVAVVKELKEQLNIEADSSQIMVRFNPIDDQDFSSESNLINKFDLNLEQNHRVIERAALDLAGVNQRIAEMEAFKAISGFRVNDLPIFEKKVESLVSMIDPDKNESRIQKVCEIADIPDFRDVGISYTIDMDRFFKIRESPECVEFREWLRTIDNKSEKEIKDQISNLRGRIAAIANTKTARSLRFLTSNALGLIPGVGVVLGFVASALDSFLIDKVLSKSGIVTFIGHMYPSLFEERGKK
jgi:hypothetical protein